MTVKVRGLAEFRRELKAIDSDLPKQLAKANREISTHVTQKARGNARAAGGVWALAAGAITGRATASAASVGVARTSRAPMALPAFWGAKARTGWFANPLKYGEYGTQHPAWVGNTWEAATRTGGPYVINYTLLEELDEVVELYGDAIDVLSSAAFPD